MISYSQKKFISHAKPLNLRIEKKTFFFFMLVQNTVIGEVHDTRKFKKSKFASNFFSALVINLLNVFVFLYFSCFIGSNFFSPQNNVVFGRLVTSEHKLCHLADTEYLTVCRQ